MNLDRGSAATTSAPLAPPDWTMDVQVEGKQLTAELKRSGVVMCRLSIARGAGEGDAATRALLADKARIWIDNYLGRRP